MIEYLPIIATGSAFLIQFGALIWRISKAEQRIYERVALIEKDLERDIYSVRQELLEAKLEMSSQYMRRDTFKDILGNLDSRLIRLEGKLDAAIAQRD